MLAGNADNLRMVSEKYLKCFVLTIPFHIILFFKRIVLLAGCHSSKSSRLSNSNVVDFIYRTNASLTRDKIIRKYKMSATIVNERKDKKKTRDRAENGTDPGYARYDNLLDRIYELFLTIAKWI